MASPREGKKRHVALLDEEEMAAINQELQEQDETREQLIKRSREILKCSKQAVYALHRGDRDAAAKLLEKAEEVISALLPLTTANPSLRHGAFSSGLEEYAEAKCFSHYLTTHTLPSLRSLPNVEKEEYLGGIADFTGELVRYAVIKATARNRAEVEQCKDMVEAIMGQLIQFDFRNGPLRKKFDSIKYNLRKLENTLYELSLIQSSGLQIQVDDAPMEETNATDE